MNKKIACLLFSLTSFNVHAQSLVNPVYQPGGAMPNLSVYDALSPLPTLNGAGWWYFVGLLHDDQKQDHSLQAMIIRNNFGSTPYGIGAIGFTFQNTQGQTLYLWNLYPDINSLVHYPIAPLSSTNADQNNYQVSIQSTSSNNPFLYQFAHDVNDVSHRVGQIGAKYFLKTNGDAEIGAAQNNLELVRYQLTMTLEDKRGVMPEGDNGFVGSNAAHLKNAQNSWEWTAPNLRVVKWKMIISPAQTVPTNALLTQTMTFKNNQPVNRVWLDRQILNKDSMVTTLMQNKLNALSSVGNNKPLYHGTWMSFCLDKAPFNNICGDAVAFWKNNTPTNLMNSNQTATGGFINIFTPDSNGVGMPIQVGTTLTETLTVNGSIKSLPYDIVNDPNSVFQSPLSDHNYAQTVYVRLHKNTLIPVYLNTLDSENENGGYTLKFVALSKQTENVMLSDQSGYYEGAANVYLCKDGECVKAGTGFMEQMGY